MQTCWLIVNLTLSIVIRVLLDRVSCTQIHICIRTHCTRLPWLERLCAVCLPPKFLSHRYARNFIPVTPQIIYTLYMLMSQYYSFPQHLFGQPPCCFCSFVHVPHCCENVWTLPYLVVSSAQIWDGRPFHLPRMRFSKLCSFVFSLLGDLLCCFVQLKCILPSE